MALGIYCKLNSTLNVRHIQKAISLATIDLQSSSIEAGGEGGWGTASGSGLWEV